MGQGKLKLDKGIFTISLDFELHWGVSDHRTVESYKENLANTPKAVFSMLDCFEKNNIEATWATVGFLFCKQKKELEGYNTKAILPAYENEHLSNYQYISIIGENEKEDIFHFAPSLIKRISKIKGQEIGSHTFSHFYTLEKGANNKQLEYDLKMAIEISNKNGFPIHSIVFPRNQYNDDVLSICKKLNIRSYRGNEQHWIYKPRSRPEETLAVRMMRLIDTYLSISGKNTYSKRYMQLDGIVNIPSSRFLRPYNPSVEMLDFFRLKRIKNEMTYAAKNNQLYHLWWHPHNFGKIPGRKHEVLNTGNRPFP